MAQRILGTDLKPAEQYNAYLLVAEAYQQAGLHEWAIDHLDKAISLDSGRLEAHFVLGLIYEIQQRWAKAREVYENIGQLSPELQPDVHLRVGQLFVAEERPEEAEREFRKVCSLLLEPADARIEQLTSGYLNTASIYRKLGKREAMREACAEVVSLTQGSPSPDHTALRRQGLAYLMREEYAEADHALRRALEANPADNKARLYLAVNLLPQGDPVEAQSQLKQAIEQTQYKADYDYAIEEAESLAERVPEVAGVPEMLRALREARDKTAQ
jgi:tetratricopeptide (TPR) repeat protein